MYQSENSNPLHAKIEKLRQGHKRHQRYPKEFWEGIAQLAKGKPLQDICRQFHLTFPYVKRKLTKLQPTATFATLDFCELSLDRGARTVIIELESGKLKAKIQGPVSCIEQLAVFFGR